MNLLFDNKQQRFVGIDWLEHLGSFGTRGLLVPGRYLRQHDAIFDCRRGRRLSESTSRCARTWSQVTNNPPKK